jgi:hypothetical protein
MRPVFYTVFVRASERYCRRKKERVRKGRRIVEAKRKCEEVRDTLFLGGESILLLEGSQAVPDRPPDDRIKVKTLSGK